MPHKQKWRQLAKETLAPNANGPASKDGNMVKAKWDNKQVSTSAPRLGDTNVPRRHQFYENQERQKRKTARELPRHGTQARASRANTKQTTAILHSNHCPVLKRKKPDKELLNVLSEEFQKDLGSYLRESKRTQSELNSMCLPNLTDP